MKESAAEVGWNTAKSPDFSMRTSARNQFTGRITHIRWGTALCEVELQLSGGESIVCIVSCDRALGLRFQVGGIGFALVNATSVIVTTDRTDGFRLSARNQLCGSIKQLHTGMENVEVSIALKGGGTLLAIVTHESAKELELTEGKAVSAIFKASSVILGVAV
jgi:molybdate transport system regulatory protein